MAMMERLIDPLSLCILSSGSNYKPRTSIPKLTISQHHRGQYSRKRMFYFYRVYPMKSLTLSLAFHYFYDIPLQPLVASNSFYRLLIYSAVVSSAQRCAGKQYYGATTARFYNLNHGNR